MSSLAIVEAFSGLPDSRRGAGRRHSQALCLALFTLAISAGCRGFLAINDWLTSYHAELLELFNPPKGRLPSYSTIRRVLLEIDLKGKYLLIKQPHIRYFISSLNETVEQFAQRIRDYWHVENKVHYVRDVTQGEDLSRIRVHPLPNIFASARNIALNLYRDQGFNNMAQAQRKAGQGLELLNTLFRMK
jgi:predicted transposase YbfD/YdcC